MKIKINPKDISNSYQTLDLKNTLSIFYQDDYISNGVIKVDSRIDYQFREYNEKGICINDNFIKGSINALLYILRLHNIRYILID